MPRPSVREQLVEAAVAHIHEHGFNASGVKDITDAAGVPKGSFYNHFESKEALALEVMDRYAKSRRLEMLEIGGGPGQPGDPGKPSGPGGPGESALARVRAHFDYLAEDLERYGYARGCLFGNFGNELSAQIPAVRSGVDQRLERWDALLTQAFEEAREAGDLHSSVDSATLARFLVGAWEGAAMRAKVAGNRGPLDDFFQVLDSMTT